MGYPREAGARWSDVYQEIFRAANFYAIFIVNEHPLTRNFIAYIVPGMTSTRPLNDRAKQFCEHYVDLGACWGSGAEAARLAGYTTERPEKEAYRLLNDERVQKYIAELCQKRVTAGAALGTYALEQFALGLRPGMDAPCSEEIQFKAAKELRELNGIMVVKKTEHTVEVTHNLSPEERRARIAVLKRDLGLEAPIDVPFEVLPAGLPAPDKVDWDTALAAFTEETTDE